MVDAYLAGDARFDGRFFTCVHTTGIYCYPSCRARKPKPENVSFASSISEAKNLGFRACKRCRPDQPPEDATDHAEAMLRSIWYHPERFSDTGDLQRLVGRKSSALAEFTRTHAHRTPLQLLNESKISAAKRALASTDATVGEIATEVGFESQSSFYEQFTRFVGMSPIAFRSLRSSQSFEMALPPEQPVGATLRTLGRDPNSPTERAEGNRIQFATKTGVARAEVKSGTIVCETEGRAEDAHANLCRYFGFGQDTASFSSSLTGDALHSVVSKNPAMRIPLTGDPFEALIWSIVGQQISLSFAYTLRRKIYEQVATPVGAGMYLPLEPSQVSQLEPSDLTPHQFSQRKAEYVVGTARLVQNGELRLADFSTASAIGVERQLMAVRGLGPWSVNYIMMRGLGFADCLPLGDTGLRAALERLHGIETKLPMEQVETLMQRYRPYRSFATYHLWQSLNMQG